MACATPIGAAPVERVYPSRTFDAITVDDPKFPGPVLDPEVEHDLLPGEKMKGDELTSNDPNVRITVESGVFHWQPTSASGGIARVHPGQPSELQKHLWAQAVGASNEQVMADDGSIVPAKGAKKA